MIAVTLQATVINARDLTPEHISLWSAIQSASPELESPFFSPEFTTATAQATENTLVGVLHASGDKPVGFFPFRLERPSFGQCLQMCDYQGVIAPSALTIDARELIRSCGLKVWEFDHLLPANPTFARFYDYCMESPAIDLRDGYEAYTRSLSPEGKRHLAKAGTSARKVQRELGPLRFEASCGEGKVMQTLHQWRSEKYGPLPEWAHELLERLRAIGSQVFAGVLSALYAGDQLLAVHFGIRSRTVLHWWFPAYNPELGNYAPGILLLLHMAQRAPELGITKIDLGKGLQDYKRRFRNTSGKVAIGSVEVLCPSTLPRIIRRNCMNYVRSSPGLLTFLRRTRNLILGKAALAI